MDFTRSEKSSDWFENVLVFFSDVLTKYNFAIPTRNQEASTVKLNY